MDDFLNHVSTHPSTVVVAPSSWHAPLLKRLSDDSKLYDVTFLTEESFLDMHQPSFKEEALFYLHHTFELEIKNAEEVLGILKSLDEAPLAPELKKYYDALHSEKMITSTPWRFNPIKSSLLVMGYVTVHPQIIKLGQRIYPDFKRIPLNTSQKRVPLYAFIKESDEVKAIAETIRKKLKENSSLDRIKIHSPSPSYNDLIKIYFERYQIPYAFTAPTSFIKTERALTLLEMLKEDKSKEELYDQIFHFLSKTNHSVEDQTIATQILRILERPYLNHRYFHHLDYIRHQFSRLNIPKKTLSNACMIGDFTHSLLEEEDLLFIIGFNEGLMPTPSLNNRFIDDKVLQKVNADTAKERTAKNTLESKALLYHDALGWVSYSKRSLTSEKIVSSLNHDLISSNRLIKTTYKEEKNVRYSIIQDLFELKKAQDTYIKYGTVDKDIYKLYASLETVAEMPKKVTHKDPYLNEKILEKSLAGKSQISYSKIEDYLKCQFRYLVKHVLKVEEPFKDRLPLLIGNLYHYALAEIDTLPESLEGRMAFYQSLIVRLESKEKGRLSEEERFYLYHLLDDVEKFITYVKNLHEKSVFKPFAYEKEYTVSLNGKTLKKMVGIVDKIMSYEDQFMIMDYKSSSRMISFKNYEFGLNSQLPFYMGVVKKEKDNLNVPSGFFYQTFDPKIPAYKKDVTMQESIEERFKLNGYVTFESLENLDPNYKEDSFIRGVKTKKDETLYANAPVLSQEEMNHLIKWIEDKVSGAIKDIESGSFKINPKGKKEDSPSCKYCEYQAICYKKESDYVPFTVSDKETFFNHVRTQYDS